MEKYYLLTFNRDYADEHNVPALACMREKEYKKWLDLKIGIYANLGNSGDGFGKDYVDYKTGKDYLNAKIVNKFIVDESFYKTFKKARLSDLSLCNVFDEDQDYED